jgi:hypothetical protein
MTDVPLVPPRIEAAFARQAKLQEMLEAAIGEHLPPPRPGQAPNDEEAFMLIVSGALPTGGYVVMPSGEMERLAQFQEAIEAAARAWSALSHDTRFALGAATGNLDPAKINGFWWVHRLPPIGIVAALPDMMRAGQKRAMREIERSGDAGRVGWRAVSLVGECRALWARRTGKHAPKAIKETGRFHDFLDAVLTAFDAGKPVPAMRAWRKLHSTAEITR